MQLILLQIGFESCANGRGSYRRLHSCAWYNKQTGEFVTGEVSWRADAKDVKASYELFNAIQQKAPEILDAGKSKNALIK